ncbi:hypothetical protein V492_08088, partial [Pseudogymnoascus sp. VKM F-4246]
MSRETTREEYLRSNFAVTDRAVTKNELKNAEKDSVCDAQEGSGPVGVTFGRVEWWNRRLCRGGGGVVMVGERGGGGGCLVCFSPPWTDNSELYLCGIVWHRRLGRHGHEYYNHDQCIYYED